MLRLVTIPIGRYCEKARWALDRAGIAYREERHVQLVHRVAARRAGGSSTVPVLVTNGGVLGESNEILVWVDERTQAGRHLFPAGSGSAARAEVDALCRRFGADPGAIDCVAKLREIANEYARTLAVCLPGSCLCPVPWSPHSYRRFRLNSGELARPAQLRQDGALLIAKPNSALALAGVFVRQCPTPK